MGRETICNTLSTTSSSSSLGVKLNGYFDEITIKTLSNIHRLLYLDKKLSVALTKYICKDTYGVPSYSFDESYFHSFKQIDSILEDVVISFTDYRLIPFPKNPGEIFVQLHLDKDSPITFLDKVYNKEDFHKFIIYIHNINNPDMIAYIETRFKDISRQYTINTVEYLWEKKCIYPYNFLHSIYGDSFVLYQLYDIDYLTSRLHDMFKARKEIQEHLPIIHALFLNGKSVQEIIKEFGTSVPEIIMNMQLVRHSLSKASFIKELFNSKNYPITKDIRYNSLSEENLSIIADKTFLANLAYGIKEQDYNLDRKRIMKRDSYVGKKGYL